MTNVVFPSSSWSRQALQRRATGIENRGAGEHSARNPGWSNQSQNCRWDCGELVAVSSLVWWWPRRAGGVETPALLWGTVVVSVLPRWSGVGPGNLTYVFGAIDTGDIRVPGKRPAPNIKLATGS